MIKFPFEPQAPTDPTREVQQLIEHYVALLQDPEALIDEGCRLAQQPHVRADPALALFLGLLIGHVASLEDDVRRLSVLCRIQMN
jgi:hypothetical protein